MSLPNSTTVDPAVDRNFRDLDGRLAAVEGVVASFVKSLGQTSPRVVWGIVNTAGSGSIVEPNSPEFSISRNGTGDVTVTFTTAFSDVPAVVLGSNRDEVFHGAPVTASACRPNTANTFGTATDGTFHFLAIGPA